MTLEHFKKTRNILSCFENILKKAHNNEIYSNMPNNNKKSFNLSNKIYNYTFRDLSLLTYLPDEITKDVI